MKRLIRKSEFHNRYKSYGEWGSPQQFEVFKNPSSKEINEIKSQSSDGGLRGIIKSNGTIYVWASDVLHNDVPTDGDFNITNGLRFAINSSEIRITPNVSYSETNLQDVINEIVQSKSALDSLGNTQTNFDIYFDNNFFTYDSTTDNVKEW